MGKCVYTVFVTEYITILHRFNTNVLIYISPHTHREMVDDHCKTACFSFTAKMRPLCLWLTENGSKSLDCGICSYTNLSSMSRCKLFQYKSANNRINPLKSNVTSGVLTHWFVQSFSCATCMNLLDSHKISEGSGPAFSRGRQLVSFRLKNPLPVPEHQN